MLFFQKKKPTNQEAQAAVKAAGAAPSDAARPRRKSLGVSSGRMDDFFRRLYCWIFSVNLSTGVYQIESGDDSFSGGPLPVRGYYQDLLRRMTDELLPEQRADFAAAFGTENLQRVSENGMTSVKRRVCARELGVEPPEGQESPWCWYEFSAEWQETIEAQRFLHVWTVRRIRSSHDSGEPVRESDTIWRNEAGEIEWELTRARRFRRLRGGIEFEYDIAEDRLSLHRLSDNGEDTRVSERFLEALPSHADFLVSHDSIDTVRELLKPSGGFPRQALVMCRREVTPDAPFRQYQVTTVALESENPKCILGTMEDVQEEPLPGGRNLGMSRAVNSLLEHSDVSLYYINTEQGLIFRIQQDESGFHLNNKPVRLREYILKRVNAGRIDPDSQGEYLRWLESGYLQRKTMRGPYEFEAKVRDMADVEAQWYAETIVAVQGKSGQFLRWRRNDTERHRIRDVEFENKELQHIGEYNRQMLDTLASLIEFRSVESSEHIARVRELTRILLEDLRMRSPQYSLTRQTIDMYVQAATMHDVGKISIPDSILNKQGRYTPEERAIMQGHTTSGATIVDRIQMPGWETLKDCIRDVALHHHERFDGNGYPDGLVGDAIPIGVQAVSLADVYDALVSERCYKEGYSFEEALQMILTNQCGSFNPCLLESLKACEKRLQSIYLEHGEQGGN